MLSDYLDYVAELDFDTRPDYAYLTGMLTKIIDSSGKGAAGKLVFSKPAKKVNKKGKKEEDEMKVDDELSRGVDDLTMDESSNIGGETSFTSFCYLSLCPESVVFIEF